MTKEERANDYAEHNIGKYTNDYANIYNAYLKGAEAETKELEKENAELKAQIEEMKTCFFCKHKNSDYDKPPCSQCKWGFPSCSHTKYKDRWEFDKTLINNKEMKEK